MQLWVQWVIWSVAISTSLEIPKALNQSIYVPFSQRLSLISLSTNSPTLRLSSDFTVFSAPILFTVVSRPDRLPNCHVIPHSTIVTITFLDDVKITNFPDLWVLFKVDHSFQLRNSESLFRLRSQTQLTFFFYCSAGLNTFLIPSIVAVCGSHALYCSIFF